MAVILVDTDVLIDALRGRNPSRDRIHDGLCRGALATTTVTVFELASGARDEAQAGSIQNLLDALEILPFDETAARAAADARQRLEVEGRTIGMADYLIAGVALSRSLPLLTRNHERFERIPELELATL